MEDTQIPTNDPKKKTELKKTALDEFVEQTNRDIRREMEQTYSAAVVERFYNPKNLGPIANADAHAKITGPCGDTLEIWLKINSNKVNQAGFITDGCCSSIACGSMATELAIGKIPEAVLEISQDDILKALGGLPEESVHCALLASNTLKEAIKNYLQQ